MITLCYCIKPEEQSDEIEWLREQKIFPALQATWDFNTFEPRVQVGVIVSPDAALAIKLRHKLDLQQEYRQR